MNINNCDYIGATGNYPIEENFIILDNKIDLTSNILNSNLSIKIYNTSNDLQSNINILKNDLWDVNSNNSNAIIKYTYENYELYNAINTTIYINENANSKIIFRSRFNNSQSQHNTEIRSDGKLYIYIDGNIIPPILPSWYNVGDTFEGIFIKDTEQDVAILGMGGALGEQQALIMKLSTQVQAMDHMFLASSVLASSPNLVSIGTELTNFALWQYVTGAFIAGLGAVAIGSAVIATRAEALANMINASYISSNALNAINLNSNISSNDKLIFTSNLENIKFINNQLIASNLYDFNILTGNINCNLTTPQFIKSLNNYDLISSNINTSNLSINNINIIDIINSNITNNSNAITTNVNNNFSKISRVFIPNTLFVYDTNNSCYTYDLDITKYVNFDLVYGGLGNPIYFKTRIFRINSYMSTDWVNLDFNNKNHLSGNAICYPETLTIFMSNNKYYNNIHTAEDNYCNGLILGKLNEKSSGYWNIIPNNFNYIRFISAQGFDMKVIIQPLQN